MIYTGWDVTSRSMCMGTFNFRPDGVIEVLDMQYVDLDYKAEDNRMKIIDFCTAMLVIVAEYLKRWAI